MFDNEINEYYQNTHTHTYKGKHQKERNIVEEECDSLAAVLVGVQTIVKLKGLMQTKNMRIGEEMFMKLGMIGLS